MKVVIKDGYCYWWDGVKHECGDEVEISRYTYDSDPARFQLVEGPVETAGGDGQ